MSPSATPAASSGSAAGCGGLRWTAPCGTRSTTGGAPRVAPHDGTACRGPGGRQRNPAVATLAREVAEASAGPAWPAVAPPVDVSAGTPADRERLRGHRAVAGGERPQAVTSADRDPVHHRAGAARHRVRAGAGRGGHLGARSAGHHAVG